MILEARASRSARTYLTTYRSMVQKRDGLPKLLGHTHVSTTMIYIHLIRVTSGGTASPLDALM